MSEAFYFTTFFDCGNPGRLLCPIRLLTGDVTIADDQFNGLPR